ncbi:hypothetical protein AMECASPLE_021268 [Ameca splendens]|uniref:Corticotropin-releasing factor domain-containing protein n=1 Tax=Ameca splendens TaxID=208324 RepID=A0ABV1AC09_9TELE
MGASLPRELEVFEVALQIPVIVKLSQVQLHQLKKNMTMKPAPLLLLLSSVLLSSHLRPAAGRPHSLPGWLDGSSRLQTQQMDDVLLRAATDSAASDLVGDKLLRLFQWRDPDRLHLLQPKVHGEEDEVLRTAAQLLKRSEEPPLSIDLTFHLLRNMIQMAKMEIQREQAQLNRKVLDEVGK